MLTESGEAIEFDSYMIPESDLEIGQLRLLDVDQRLVVPVDTHVRYIVTGEKISPLTINTIYFIIKI
jgi:cytochrome c oxidase subunit 2